MPPRVHWIAKLTRAPASRWQDRGPWSARLRRWVLHTICRYDSETCDACGRRVEAAWWSASGRLWSMVVERVGQPCKSTDLAERGCLSGILCMRCFGKHAQVLGVPVHWVAEPLRESCAMASSRNVLWAPPDPDSIDDFEVRS